MMPSKDSRSSSNSDRNSVASNEGVSHHGRSSSQFPVYLLEHLATFTVSPENDLVYPADGMRRLLALEKTNGIWTQKMLMKLERKMVLIMDHENKEIVERFPLDFLQEPTAFTSNDPKEMYNNILIYIVGDLPENSSCPSEMHIFQCVNVRARDVVEDLKAFLMGKPLAKNSRRNWERNHHEVDHGVQVGDLLPYGVSESILTPLGQQRMQACLPSSGGGGAVHSDETSSTSSEKYEREVVILNRCFDDIEKFISRLQYAAGAFRELEKRRRSRKTKKKDLGDGMLSIRAKPPPEAEFVDIFQKFKLSFNLLAKLRAFIHEPNSPELVHFLFTPLALIVDASHDSHYGPNLPSKVVTPLLTSSAVELLINCLTSKESELWHSLGESWYIPYEEWKGFVGPYKPVFMDGWSPSLPTYMGKEEDEDDVCSTVHTNEEVDFAIHREQPQRFSPRRFSPPERNMNMDQQHAWAEDLLSQGCKLVTVTYPRSANNVKELTVERGEYLELIDDSRKWWKVRNIRGQMGHVPHTIVSQIPFQSEREGDVTRRDPHYSRGHY